MSTIFETKFAKRGKSKDEFVGFHMAKGMVDTLRLYAIAKGISQSRVLRNLVVQHLYLFDTVGLEKEIISIAQAHWNTYKVEHKKEFKRAANGRINYTPLFEAYKKQVRKELMKKKVPLQEIKLITNRLKK